MTTINGTYKHRRLADAVFATYTPEEGEIVINFDTDVLKTKTTNESYYYPTCSVVQVANEPVVGLFTPSTQAVCAFVDKRGKGFLTEGCAYKTEHGKAIYLSDDTVLTTWSGTANSGLYNVQLLSPQGNLPAGWWYINLDRHSNDTVGNDYRILTARDLNNTNPYKMFKNQIIDTSWTGWIEIPTQIATNAEVITGTDTSKVVTPYSLSSVFNASGRRVGAVATGYQKLPGGLVMEWGLYPLGTPTSGTLTLTAIKTIYNVQVTLPVAGNFAVGSTASGSVNTYASFTWNSYNVSGSASPRAFYYSVIGVETY